MPPFPKSGILLFFNLVCRSRKLTSLRNFWAYFHEIYSSHHKMRAFWKSSLEKTQCSRRVCFYCDWEKYWIFCGVFHSHHQRKSYDFVLEALKHVTSTTFRTNLGTKSLPNQNLGQFECGTDPQNHTFFRLRAQKSSVVHYGTEITLIFSILHEIPLNKSTPIRDSKALMMCFQVYHTFIRYFDIKCTKITLWRKKMSKKAPAGGKWALSWENVWFSLSELH